MLRDGSVGVLGVSYDVNRCFPGTQRGSYVEAKFLVL